MKFALLISAALTLVACATTKTGSATATSSGPATASGELTIPDEQLPNGRMKTCRVVKKDIEVAGMQMLIMEGGSGIFLLPLPEAPDWKFECDDEKPFWAFSKTARMQVSVSPHRAQPGEDLSLKNYLTNIGANVKAGIESQGVRVSGLNVSQIHTGDQDEVFGLEMIFDAPEGRTLPLFPQNIFFTARPIMKDALLDLHLTTYPRDGSERVSMRSTARVVLGSFSVNASGL